MKFYRGIYPILLFILPIVSLAQNPARDEIAVNESELSYIEEETSEFAKTYGFDTRFNTFKEVYRKTYMYLTPEMGMRNVVMPVPRTSIVKAYKLLKQEHAWAVKYENNWGFISADDLISIEEYEEPLVNDDLDVPPKLLSNLSFRYPSAARKDSISGEVVLRLLVSKTGAVSRIEFEKSIPALDSAAIRAVKKLRFKPAKKYGVPTDVWVRVPMNFELD